VAVWDCIELAVRIWVALTARVKKVNLSVFVIVDAISTLGWENKV